MIMHKNPVWLCFLAIVFLITAIYTAKVGIKLFRHLQLTSETEASATAWSIHTESEGEYIPLAKYTYLVNDRFYNAQMLFYDEMTNNPWAADESLKVLAAKKHHVWYAPKDPANSSMQKEFPLKDSISAGVLWALSIYFFWLGVYAAKVKQ